MSGEALDYSIWMVFIAGCFAASRVRWPIALIILVASSMVTTIFLFMQIATEIYRRDYFWQAPFEDWVGYLFLWFVFGLVGRGIFCLLAWPIEWWLASTRRN